MVCCNYIRHDDTSATYAFGGYDGDITGEIRFNLTDGSFDVVKEPENSEVYPRSLYRLYAKYKSDFENRIFKDKISFES